jgi:hypothetical protein
MAISEVESLLVQRIISKIYDIESENEELESCNGNLNYGLVFISSSVV